jgi:Uma2 family endonuclease
MTVAAPEAAYPGRPAHRYLRPPQPLHFPVEERVPEARRHFLLRTALFHTVWEAFRAGAAVGSDQFVYWDPTDPHACCAPDVFVKAGAIDESFESWKAWERGAPDLVVEITSASDANEGPWDQKLDRFRRLGAKEIVRFDPEDAERPLRIWDGADGDVTERDPADPGFNRCDTLSMYLCVYRDAELGPALGVARDAEGRDRLPTPAEARKRADEARQREAEARKQADEARQKAERRIAELEAELARRGGA